MKTWLGKSLIVVVLVLVAGTCGWAQSQPLSFGVIIHRSPTLTAQFWNPILRYVSARSGVPLQLRAASTGPEHTAMVGRGALDFLYSNHNFIKENEASGYRVFARPQGNAGRGEIVVLADASIHSLADLEGKDVSFPHTAAFLGYHLTMDVLLRQGIQVKPLFAGNQEGAIGQLKAGRTIAAGVSAEVMQAFAAREQLAYRVLWRSEEYLNLALSAHPSIPEAQVQAVRDAFVHMAADPEGARVLESSADLLKQTSPLRFIAAHDSEFDNMRQFYRTTSVQVELQ
jgi:phosphonate transport system substrate-binding protein